MGATNTLERMAASIGQLDGAVPCFEKCADIPSGGVLFALPALLAVGLLKGIEKYFQLPKGYYRLDSLFLLLAFMALARLKDIESLRYVSPGEWGKLLGLDRIPEAKTLREKVGLLSHENQLPLWSKELSQQWMEATESDANILYIDGHVRVYHGDQTALPKHYIARQKLCLRATADYWVNAMDGQPFFKISQAVDPGLIQTLETDIVPRLEQSIPAVTAEALAENPLSHRFTMVFDREGYSPDFFKKMKQKRIACLSYHKHPEEAWPEEEFREQSVTLVSGHVVTLRLAERGTWLGKKIWVREIRKLRDNGEQTSILSTDYLTDHTRLAASMFARWSQENFFKYMRQHYSLDRLIQYSTEEIPDTTKIVNPAYRQLDSEVKKQAAKLSRHQAEFGALLLVSDIEPKKVEIYEQKKALIQEKMGELEQQITQAKAQRKQTPRHITLAELPDELRFRRLDTQSKCFIDTIKMIAYRAETAMANVLRETLTRSDEARRLLTALYKTEVDLIPDEKTQTLTVRLHPMANHANEAAVRQLCKELNDTQTLFPCTNLTLIYETVAQQNPRDQVV